MKNKDLFGNEVQEDVLLRDTKAIMEKIRKEKNIKAELAALKIEKGYSGRIKLDSEYINHLRNLFLLNDIEFIKKLCDFEKSCYPILKIGPDIISNLELWNYVLDKKYLTLSDFNQVPEALRFDKKYIIKFINTNHSSSRYTNEDVLSFSSAKLKSDEEVHSILFMNGISPLRYYSEEKKNDLDSVVRCLDLGREDDILYIGSELIQKEDVVLYFLWRSRSPAMSFKLLDVNYKTSFDFLEKAFWYVQPNEENIKYLISNRELLLSVLRYNGWVLYFLPLDYKKDREIVKTAIEHRGRALLLADESLKKDKELVEIALRTCDSETSDYVFNIQEDINWIIEIAEKGLFKDNNISSKLKKILYRNRRIVLSLIKQDTFFYRNIMSSSEVEKEWINDLEIHIEALKNDFRNIEYTPLWIKECKAFGDYLNTLSDDELISAFDYLPVKLRSDINLTKKAISKKSEYLEYTSLENKANPEIANLCLDGIKWLSDKFKMDKDFAIKAAYYNGNNLKYLSDSLKSDKEVVLAALDNNPNSFQYASSELKDDENTVLEFLDKSSNPHVGNIVHECNSLIKVNSSLVEKACRKGLDLLHLPVEFYKDRKLLFLALKSTDAGGCSEFFKHKATKEMKKDRLFIYELLMQPKKIGLVDNLLPGGSIYQNSYIGMDKKLKSDKEFIISLLEKGVTIYQIIDQVLQQDIDLARKSLIIFPFNEIHSRVDKMISAMDILWPKELLDDKELMKEVVSKHPNFHINVSFRLRNDKDLALVYLNNSNIYENKSIAHLSYNLRNDPELVDIAIKKGAYNIGYTGIDSYNCKSNIELVLKNSPRTVNACGHSAVDYLDSIDLKYVEINPSGS